MLNVSYCDHSLSVVHSDSFIQILKCLYMDVAYLDSESYFEQ